MLLCAFVVKLGDLRYDFSKRVKCAESLAVPRIFVQETQEFLLQAIGLGGLRIPAFPVALLAFCHGGAVLVG